MKILCIQYLLILLLNIYKIIILEKKHETYVDEWDVDEWENVYKIFSFTVINL